MAAASMPLDSYMAMNFLYAYDLPNSWGFVTCPAVPADTNCTSAHSCTDMCLSKTAAVNLSDEAKTASTFVCYA